MRARVAFFISVLVAAVSTGTQPQESTCQLHIPELNLTLPGDSAGFLSTADVNTFDIIIRSTGISYGSVKAKINTESAGIIMGLKSVGSDVVCTFDLKQHAGFRFQAGRNSVEIEARDSRNRVLYASFLLTVGTPTQTRPVRPSEGRPEDARGIEKYAVIIGVSKYKDPAISPLQFADRDAEAVRDFLLSPAGGRFPRERIRYLVNEDATLTNVRTALRTFLAQPRKDDLVVIYFAGHGSPDPNDRRLLYLLTYDSEALNMGGTAFPMEEVPDIFGRVVKSRRVITFTDACHSGGVSGAVSGGRGPSAVSSVPGNNLVNQYLAHYAGEGERAVMTASDISESSREGGAWGGGHGVFTYFLLEGLKGKADRNGDGTVTAGELFDYVREQVARATDEQQNPTALPGLARDLPLSGAALRTATP